MKNGRIVLNTLNGIRQKKGQLLKSLSLRIQIIRPKRNKKWVIVKNAKLVKL